MTDGPSHLDLPPIVLPPSRRSVPSGGDGGAAGPEAARRRRAGGGGGPGGGGGGDGWHGPGGNGAGPSGGHHRGGRGLARRGTVLVVAGVVVAAAAVAVAAGPMRDRLRSALGDKPTTTTIPGPVAVPIPPGFRLANIVNRYHELVPSLQVADMRRLLVDGSITSSLLPPGGVPPALLPRNGSALEGLLMPSTYSVPHGASARLVLQNMVSAMEDEATKLGIGEAAARLGLTPYQIVTVASMVQAEAGNVDEEPKIARVIYNRLARHEPVGIDATTKYLKCVTTLNVQVCQSPLTASDFKVDSPYNTRTHTGLPPTPIGAPSEDALMAAMHPADGPWRFYVRDTQNDAQGRPQHLFFNDNTSAEYRDAVKACMATKLGC